MESQVRSPEQSQFVSNLCVCMSYHDRHVCVLLLVCTVLFFTCTVVNSILPSGLAQGWPALVEIQRKATWQLARPKASRLTRNQLNLNLNHAATSAAAPCPAVLLQSAGTAVHNRPEEVLAAPFAWIWCCSTLYTVTTTKLTYHQP